MTYNMMDRQTETNPNYGYANPSDVSWLASGHEWQIKRDKYLKL